MKHILHILGVATLLFGMCSCDSYVAAGPGPRPGYYSSGFRPGYSRPGYAYSPYRSTYNRPGYGYSPYRPGYSNRSRHYHPSSYNRGNGWDRNRSYYRGSDRVRTNTRVNVGPLGLNNANFLRF